MVINRRRTLAGLGGNAEAFVVGGYGLRGRWPLGPGAMAHTDVPPYVSQGCGPEPTSAGRAGPDVEAPCDDSPVQHGLLAAGNRSGSRFRMDGTSVAAPLVARRLLNLIADSNPPRSSLHALLCSGDGRIRPGDEPQGQAPAAP